MTIKEINPELNGMFYLKSNGMFESMDYNPFENNWRRNTEQASGRRRVKILSNRGAVKWYQRHKDSLEMEILPF